MAVGYIRLDVEVLYNYTYCTYSLYPVILILPHNYYSIHVDSK